MGRPKPEGLRRGEGLACDAFAPDRRGLSLDARRVGSKAPRKVC